MKQWMLIAACTLSAQMSLAAPQSGLLGILAKPESHRLELGAQLKSEEREKLRSIAFSDQYQMAERWKALTLYTSLQKQKALPSLQKAVAAKEWYMRNAGLVAMQEINIVEAKKAARKLLHDRALVVRSAAVGVLGQSVNEGDRQTLWELMYDKKNFRKGQSLWIRPQILSALAENPSQQEMSLFLKYVKEENPAMQVASVAGLERLTKKKMSVSDWQKQAGND